MPYFNYEADIDVSEYLYSCTSVELQQVIGYLVDNGYIPEIKTESKVRVASISEMEYNDALDNLAGKWNMLSKEDEELILSISKKY